MLKSEIQKELTYLEQLIKDGTNFLYIREKAESLLVHETTQNDKSLCAEIMILIAKAHFFIGNIQESQSIVERILLTQSEIEKSTYANALMSLANIYQVKADFAKSIECSLRATEIFEMEQHTRGLALSFTNIGITYRLIADYTKSLEYMDKGRRLYMELGDEAGVAANTGNIGNVYVMMNLFSKALEYQNKALEVNEKINNLRGIANNCLTIGGVYILTKEYQLAESFLDRALEVFKVLQDKTGQMHVQSNIGILLDLEEKYDEAFTLNQEVLSYMLEKDDKVGISQLYVNIANIYAKPESTKYDPTLAEEYYTKALELLIALNLKEQECSIHKQMSDLYEHLQSWEKSFYHLKQYQLLNDELHSEEAKNKADILEQRRRLDEFEQDKVLQIARLQEQERILHKILPITIADRILDGETTLVEHAKDISIFFSDIVDFTEMTSSMNPGDLINDLNKLFTEFDRIARKHAVEKIKTIGDAYMAVCGIPIYSKDHALNIANFAFDVMSASKNFKIGNRTVELRVGIHSGEAIAGVIGEDKYSYDLWGDCVNIASRMENSGEKGCIQVTEFFKGLLDDQPYISFVSRGEIEIKGKGLMKTYFMHQSNKT